MIELLLLAAFVWLAMGGVFSIASFVLFDRVLKHIKGGSETAWVELGKPIGFFWMPSKEASTISGGFARSALYANWSAGGRVNLPGADTAIARLQKSNQIAKAWFVLGLLHFLGAVVCIFGGYPFL